MKLLSFSFFFKKRKGKEKEISKQEYKYVLNITESLQTIIFKITLYIIVFFPNARYIQSIFFI